MTTDRKPPNDGTKPGDDAALDTLLGGYASDARPHPNARKTAVNLAMAAFDDAQKADNTEKSGTVQKIFQGLPFLSRLTTRPNREKGTPTMARNTDTGSNSSSWKPMALGLTSIFALVAVAAVTTTGQEVETLFGDVGETTDLEATTDSMDTRVSGIGNVASSTERRFWQSEPDAEAPMVMAQAEQAAPARDESAFGGGAGRSGAESAAPAGRRADADDSLAPAESLADAAPAPPAPVPHTDHELQMLQKEMQIAQLQQQLQRMNRQQAETDVEIAKLEEEVSSPGEERLQRAMLRELERDPDKILALQGLSSSADGYVIAPDDATAGGSLFEGIGIRPPATPPSKPASGSVADALPADAFEDFGTKINPAIRQGRDNRFEVRPRVYDPATGDRLDIARIAEGANNSDLEDEVTGLFDHDQPIVAAAPPVPAPTTVPLAVQGLKTEERVAEMDRLRALYRDGQLKRFERPQPRPAPEVATGDKYQAFTDYPMTQVDAKPVSTFSVDVDTASYALVRRQIMREGRLPQRHSVRVEELINYFDYSYPVPDSREVPFATSVAVTGSPWAEGRKLVHVGIKGYQLPEAERPRANLTFLIDVSGSMRSADKLPLLKRSFTRMLDALNPDDRVSIVVYAGAAGVVLEPTRVAEKSTIIRALNNLQSGGSTAGAAGLQQAYTLARAVYDTDSVNRVILATDGDFNVGISNHTQLKEYIAEQRDSGISLSVLGFGSGNYNDQLMQALAQNGNGNAAYIDSDEEAHKVLVEQASGTLFTIAKDVKLQIEFNPATVQDYRLIGYETRALRREDFDNDRIDAGEIGAGHTVTAIYEITPVGAMQSASLRGGEEPLRYQTQAQPAAAQTTGPMGQEYAFLKIRFKQPEATRSELITRPITAEDEGVLFNPCVTIGEYAGCGDVRQVRDDVGFATAVAGFGQMLRGARATSGFGFRDAAELARAHAGDDPRRLAFVEMVERAADLAGER